MKTTELKFGNIDAMKEGLNKYVKRNIGPGTYLSKIYRITENDYVFKIGNTYPAFVYYPENKPPVVKFLDFDAIGTIKIKRKDDAFISFIPSRETLIEKGNERYNSLIVSAENVLLDKTYTKLVMIPLVQTAMSRIREILVTLEYDQEINLLDYPKKERGKLVKYLSFLEDLNYVRKENDIYIEGNRLSVIKHKLNKENVELYNKVLADVLRKGYPYMSKHLRLLQIVPFLRIANSYYLPSYQLGELLSMEKHKFVRFIEHYLKLFYNHTTTRTKLNNQINQVVASNILQKQHDKISGYENIFSDFLSDFSAMKGLKSST